MSDQRKQLIYGWGYPDLADKSEIEVLDVQVCHSQIAAQELCIKNGGYVVEFHLGYFISDEEIWTIAQERPDGSRILACSGIFQSQVEAARYARGFPRHVCVAYVDEMQVELAQTLILTEGTE